MGDPPHSSQVGDQVLNVTPENFWRQCAKLREVSEVVLGVIENLNIFVIKCIFDFFNPMSSFGEKCHQSGRIGPAVVKVSAPILPQLSRSPLKQTVPLNHNT